MDSFQRVVNTFKGLETDRIPIFHIGFSSQTASLLLGREAYIGGGIQQWREATALWEGREAHREFLERSLQDALDIAKLCNMDIVRPSYWRMPVKPSKKLNDNEFLYGSEDNWVIRRYEPSSELYDVVASCPPKRDMTFEDLEKLLDSEEKELDSYDATGGPFDAVREALGACGRKKAIRANAGQLDIPMEPIWLEAVILRPDLVERHIGLQVRRAFIDIAYLSSLGISFIFGGGDLASSTGPVYSPETFRRLLMPAARKIADECHRRGMLYLYNSDGNLWPISDHLFGGSGVDGYYEIDRQAGMDLARLRARYPDLALIGNISSLTLHLGSREAVIGECMSCIETAKAYGRIVIGCSNYPVPGTPIENVWAMIETLEKYC